MFVKGLSRFVDMFFIYKHILSHNNKQSVVVTYFIITTIMWMQYYHTKN